MGCGGNLKQLVKLEFTDRPVILSERSESKDLTALMVRRSLDKLGMTGAVVI